VSSAVPWQRLLTVKILQLPALRSCLHSRPCRTRFNCLTQQPPSLHSTELHSDSKSESELLYDWQFTANQFVLATSPLRLTTSNFFFQLNTCGYSPYVTSSLTRGWVCRLQLLLVLSAVILRSESRGTHDHILLSQIRDSPNLEGQVPVFISPRNRMILLYPQALGFLFVASYDSKRLRWRYSTLPPHGIHCTQPAWGRRYIVSWRTQQKTPPPTVPLLSWAVA
jgi:hypothetical protein